MIPPAFVAVISVVLKEVPYEIKFADAAIKHLGALRARERKTVVDVIEEQLSHEPLVETRNRKPLRPNPIAAWELRLESLRVFYDVTAPEALSAEFSGSFGSWPSEKKIGMCCG